MEGDHIKLIDFEPVVDTNKAFQLVSELDTTKRLGVWDVSTFDNMKDDHHNVVHDCFSTREGTFLYLTGCSAFAHGWRKSTKGHPISMTYDWNAFELLLQHLEYKAFQTHEKEHRLKLRIVEHYWKARVELVYALKEGIVSSFIPLTTKKEPKEGE